MSSPAQPAQTIASQECVIVYGLTGTHARRNTLVAHVCAYNERANTFTVAFADGDTLTLDGGNLFFPARMSQYFDRPVDTLPFITECTTVVHLSDARYSVVATKPMRAGQLYACPHLRVHMTWPEIHAVEREFAAYMSDNLHRLMGSPEGSVDVVFEPNYNPVLVFVAEVAKIMHDPTINSVSVWDPTSDECLAAEWRRCNGVDLLWYDYWRSKLAHLTPLEVWRVWHLVRTAPVTTRDRLTLIFGQTLCQMQNHPEREAEYEKVSDGLQDVSVDRLTHKHLPTCIMTPEFGDLKAYCLENVKVGQELFTDNGPGFRNNLCDTVLGCLFMSFKEGGRWLNVYTNVLQKLDKRVTRHFLAYFQANCKRVKALRPAPSVRTTPAVHATPAEPSMPLCDYCSKPMLFPFVCARCRVVTYCHKACQTEAWKTHKKECKPCQPRAGAK